MLVSLGLRNSALFLANKPCPSLWASWHGKGTGSWHMCWNSFCLFPLVSQPPLPFVLCISSGRAEPPQAESRNWDRHLAALELSLSPTKGDIIIYLMSWPLTGLRSESVIQMFWNLSSFGFKFSSINEQRQNRSQMLPLRSPIPVHSCIIVHSSRRQGQIPRLFLNHTQLMMSRGRTELLFSISSI